MPCSSAAVVKQALEATVARRTGQQHHQRKIELGTRAPVIGLARFGCTNRPFFRVCVFAHRALGRRADSRIVEQVGSFDPLPNVRNEKLVALDVDRLKYWIGERNASVSVPLLELLGLAGILPIHPKTYIRAGEARAAAERQAAVEEEKRAKREASAVPAEQKGTAV